MTYSATTAQPLSAHEAVRRALSDIAEAGRRGAPDGVSAAAMAHAAEVSPQYVGKILAGERAASVDFIAALPSRARAVALSALHAFCSRPSHGTVEGSLASVISGAGEWLSLAGRILSDGKADAGEQVKATLALQALRAQIDSVLARLAEERGGNVVGIGGKRG